MNALQIICPSCKIPMNFGRDEETMTLSAFCDCGNEYHIYEPNVGYHEIRHNDLPKVEKENDADASPARKASRDELLKLIQHCWLHSGYRNCGYKQMTDSQKKLFDSILGTDIEKGI